MSVEVAEIPDVERIISDFLREHPLTEGYRIVGQTPKSLDQGWARVHSLDEFSKSAADHLVDFMVQIDCYAGKDDGQPQVNEMSRLIRRALYGIRGVRDGGVCSRPRISGGPRQLDTDIKPPREWKPLTVQMVVHR